MENKKIRVLLVTDTYYPKFDGPVLVAASYAKNFNTMPDIKADIVAPHFSGYKDTDLIKIIRVKSKPSKEGYYRGIPKKDKLLRKHLKSNKYDIIHCHSPFPMCRFFAKYGKKHNIPTVFTFHTKFHEDFARILRTRLTRKIMMCYIMSNIKKCDYALSVSNGAADVLRGYGYKKDIGVIRNGTDLTYPNNAAKLVTQINEKYGIDKAETVFLSVGRIVSNKNLHLAFEALKIVKDSGHSFKFLIVGSGPEEDNLKKLSIELNLDNNVIFTGKIMDRDLLSAHYLRSDLLMLPSMFDTSSLVLLEAAALKLPTIMNRSCIPAEVITDGVNGILAELDPESWAKKIIWVIQNKDKMAKLKENVHSQVFRDWTTVSNEVKRYYEQIIKNRK